MPLKIAFVLLFLSFTSISQAGFFLGGYGGQSSDRDGDFEELKGNVLGFKTGWRWNWIALEVARTSYNMNMDEFQGDKYYVEKAEVKGNVTDLMLRFYPLFFLSIAAGYSSLDLDTDIRLTNIDGNPANTYTSDGSVWNKGYVMAAGVHLPLGSGFQLFGEYVSRRWSSYAKDVGIAIEDVPELGLHEWHVGLVWEWGGGGKRKGKKKNEDQNFLF